MSGFVHPQTLPGGEYAWGKPEYGLTKDEYFAARIFPVFLARGDDFDIAAGKTYRAVQALRKEIRS